MPTKILSSATVGIDAQIIEVETDVSFGLKRFDIVGLPDKAVEESKERVGAAIKSAGFDSPHRKPHKVLVNLAPADLKKEGSLYDLPIALGYLSASGQIPQDKLTGKVFCGELSLKGEIRAIKGSLSFALAAEKNKIKELILPQENVLEASLILLNKNKEKSLKIIGFKTLKEVIDYLEGKIKPNPVFPQEDKLIKQNFSIDFSWIKGQESSKRAIEISAAGNHNLLMQGPPGSGKSLLAKAFPSITPNLSFEEIIEVTKIYSIAGLLTKETPFINYRPFRSPHHTASESALIGGGNPPRPGEVTLAHRGILFLDEFPEFHRDVLESLRQPMEDGKITISRARNHFTFPAKFTLIAAANPCPCGYLNDTDRSCTCARSQISAYRRKLSGPLIDRIDILIEVPRLKFDKLNENNSEESSEKIKKRVEKARKMQYQRFLKEKINILTNSEMTIPEIKKYCQIEPKGQTLLRRFVDSGQLSGRGYHRVLKTARTIADLEESENIKYDHLAEALMYRIKDFSQL